MKALIKTKVYLKVTDSLLFSSRIVKTAVITLKCVEHTKKKCDIANKPVLAPMMAIRLSWNQKNSGILLITAKTFSKRSFYEIFGTM